MKTRIAPEYTFIIRHLTQDDGGGYLIEFPDLPGCISDGKTILEAIDNGRDAVCAWIETAEAMGRAIPKPGMLENQSGKWVQRVPKSIHLRLAHRAKQEGVSLNTLVVMMLAESLGAPTMEFSSTSMVSEPCTKYSAKAHSKKNERAKRKPRI